MSKLLMGQIYVHVHKRCFIYYLELTKLSTEKKDIERCQKDECQEVPASNHNGI